MILLGYVKGNAMYVSTISSKFQLNCNDYFIAIFVNDLSMWAFN